MDPSRIEPRAAETPQRGLFRGPARARGKSKSYRERERDNIGGAHNDPKTGSLFARGQPPSAQRSSPMSHMSARPYRELERWGGGGGARGGGQGTRNQRSPGVGWRWGIIARLRSLREEDSAGRLHRLPVVIIGCPPLSPNLPCRALAACSYASGTNRAEGKGARARARARCPPVFCRVCVIIRCARARLDRPASFLHLSDLAGIRGSIAARIGLGSGSDAKITGIRAAAERDSRPGESTRVASEHRTPLRRLTCEREINRRNGREGKRAHRGHASGGYLRLTITGVAGRFISRCQTSGMHSLSPLAPDRPRRRTGLRATL